MNDLIAVYLTALSLLERYLQPLLGLSWRFWVASVFFKSGLVKIQSWSSTLSLFEYEYQVPVLSPILAAYLGTAAELTLPVLLVFGLATRPAALALFVFNGIAVISYPDISPAGVQEHWLWGCICAVIFFYGPGKLSLDHWLKQRFIAVQAA